MSVPALVLRLLEIGGQNMKGIIGPIAAAFCVFAAACAGAAPTATNLVVEPNRGRGRNDGGTRRFGVTVQGHVRRLGNRGDGAEPPPSRCDRQRHPSRSIHSDGRLDGQYGRRRSRPAAHGRPPTAMNFSRVLQDPGVSVPPTITFTETHTITGGTGRFANASGTFTVVQTRGLSMPYNNSATIDGTINLGH